jgi:hypothetical protein
LNVTVGGASSLASTDTKAIPPGTLSSCGKVVAYNVNGIRNSGKKK